MLVYSINICEVMSSSHEVNIVKYCRLNKKRYEEMKTSFADLLQNTETTEHILEIIRGVMKFDPNMKMYNEATKRGVQNYRQKQKEKNKTT